MNDENKIIIEYLNTFGRVPEQWELLKMIKQLQSNWNSLREWINNTDRTIDNNFVVIRVKDVLDKMHELEGGEILDNEDEEKKIPEKLGKIDDNDGYIDQNDVIKIGKKVDEIIDYLQYLKSKGE